MEVKHSFDELGFEDSLAAFNEVHARYLPMVLNVCARLVGVAQAEDAAQEVFLLLFQKGASVERRFMARWLYVTACHICSEMRRNSAANSRKLIAWSEDPAIRLRLGARGSRIDCDREVVLESALMCLTERQREAIVLHHLKGETRSSVGQQMGLSVEGVKFHLRQGLARLAELTKRSQSSSRCMRCAMSPVAARRLKVGCPDLETCPWLSEF
jgi:RNA polymerase sigma-70 factor (ECF subfamily)